LKIDCAAVKLEAKGALIGDFGLSRLIIEGAPTGLVFELEPKGKQKTVPLGSCK